MNKKYFYISTPIYYVNGPPHIGHLYSTIYTDIIARFQREQGKEVIFVTGCDQHGEKVNRTARANKQSVQKFVEQNTIKFRNLWKRFNISYTHFVETTNSKHKKFVLDKFKQIISSSQSKPRAELTQYVSFYCQRCEWLQPKNLVWQNPKTKQSQNNLSPQCSNCQTVVTKDVLEQIIFVFKIPQEKRNWITNLLTKTFSHLPWIKKITSSQELSQIPSEWPITTSKNFSNWGIDLTEIMPQHQQTINVWFDALLSYLSFLQPQTLSAIWHNEANNNQSNCLPKSKENIEIVHVLGKDILRFHMIFWPLLLSSLNYRLPDHFLIHGWILTKGKKISKSSRETLLSLEDFIDVYDVDVLRLFFAFLFNLKEDIAFKQEHLSDFYNNYVVKDLSNYLYRLSVMLNKYQPDFALFDKIQSKFCSSWSAFKYDINRFISLHKQHFGNFDVRKVVINIFTFLKYGNTLIEKEEPWNLFKNNKNELLILSLYKHLVIIKNIALFLHPITPQLAQKIFSIFNFKPGLKIDDFRLIWQTNTKIVIANKLFEFK